MSESKVTERFDIWWRAYPKKVGKLACLKRWERLRPDETLFGQIMTALVWQVRCEQWTKSGGQFIPNPLTYLNQGRWLDEPTMKLQVKHEAVYKCYICGKQSCESRMKRHPQFPSERVCIESCEI